MDDESALLESIPSLNSRPVPGIAKSFLRSQRSGADRGSAHHGFLQFVSLERVGSAAELKAEAERLVRQNSLTSEEAALLDFKSLAKFWRSDLGKRIVAQKDAIRRELRFTARISAAEVADLVGKSVAPDLAKEFVVIQGVADLAVILPREIWLVDFKTDSVKPAEVAEKARFYEPQIKLYSRALSEIYQRPVSEAWLCFLAIGESVEIKLIRNGVGAAL
jgi:ATP-dependent helicase/nuclease subunit A